MLHLISGFYILEVLPGIRSYLLMFCLCLSFSENTVICYTLSIFYLFCRERIRQWAAVYTIYIYCTRLIIYMSCKRAYFWWMLPSFAQLHSCLTVVISWYTAAHRASSLSFSISLFLFSLLSQWSLLFSDILPRTPLLIIDWPLKRACLLLFCRATSSAIRIPITVLDLSQSW